MFMFIILMILVCLSTTVHSKRDLSVRTFCFGNKCAKLSGSIRMCESGMLKNLQFYETRYRVARFIRCVREITSFLLPIIQNTLSQNSFFLPNCESSIIINAITIAAGPVVVIVTIIINIIAF